jgi:nucleoside 2-deoxyribosyltransferase
MKIYIAHNYAARQMLAETVVPILTGIGHTITSRWITDSDHGDVNDQCAQALIDLQDIDRADGLLFFTVNFGNRPGKGKYVELGYAMASCKKVFLFGEDDSCVFYHLPPLYCTRILDLQEIPLSC